LDYIYVLLPPIAWVVAGSSKFAVNYLRYGAKAFGRIGNGGFPSTHTTVVSSAVMLVGFKQGFASPVFCIGEALLLIIIIDALGLRRAVGRHAAVLNRIAGTDQPLRESQGHSMVEVLGGLLLGLAVGYFGSMVGG
jgi:hypothetical protein